MSNKLEEKSKTILSPAHKSTQQAFSSQPSRGHQNRRFKREQHTYSEQFLLFRGHEPYTISNYDTEKWINKTRYQFTIELTLTAEGGQSTESLFVSSYIRLGIFDRCQPDRHPAIEVRFELNDESEEQENRLTVRLQSSMSNEIHRLRFHKPLRLYRTERIQITFDGNSLRVYRNGALERLMFETFSIPLFSETESKCKIVRVFPNHFHGWIHSDYNMEFASVNEEDESEIGVPSCGVSVCDNPVVLKNYATNVERRKQKVLRYRVVVISENDGSNPTVTDEQIELQHRDLTDAFGRYNITWKLHIERINNSNVRHKMIVFGCDQESLNGNCDSDCRGLSFGNDECKNTLVCPVKSIKNGICNPECNTEQNHWDGGDCCQEEENNRCFDPKSKYRFVDQI
ncbi:Pappalysin-2 [Aphelenchoides besseyi]|nr:Pappalysin-2 [Aphelenchoides besseyi]